MKIIKIHHLLILILVNFISVYAYAWEWCPSSISGSVLDSKGRPFACHYTNPGVSFFDSRIPLGTTGASDNGNYSKSDILPFDKWYDYDSSDESYTCNEQHFGPIFAFVHNRNAGFPQGWWTSTGVVGDRSLAEPIYLTPGENTPEINFYIKAGRYVTGNVTDINDNPIDYVKIKLIERSGQIYTTDVLENGEYIFYGIPKGIYYVSTDVGWNGNTYNHVDLYWNGYEGAVEKDYAGKITLGSNIEDERDQINIKLPVGGGIRGYVKNSEGYGVPNIDIEVKSVTTGELFASTTSDDTGFYIMHTVRPGFVYVSTVGNGQYVRTYYDGNKNTGNPNDSKEIEIISDEEQTDINIILWPEPKPPTGTDNIGINTDNQETMTGDPVNVVNGNMYYDSVDLSMPSIKGSISFKRYYNSVSSTDTPIGFGWCHNFMIRLDPPEDTIESAKIFDHQSRLVEFAQIYSNIFQAYSGNNSTLIKTETGYIWQKKNLVKYNFDLTGKLLFIEDRNGNRVELGYDETDRLISILDETGRSFSIAYGANNRIFSISDPVSRTVNYEYDLAGNLIRVTDPSGVQTNYTYSDPNDEHNMTSHQTDNGYGFAYTYDDQDRCINASGEGGGHGNSFEYHPESSYTRITDAKGKVTLKYYNEYGYINNIVFPNGKTNQLIWDDYLNKTGFVDEDGNAWQYSYDIKGNLLSVVDPLNQSTTMTYDENNNLLSVTDEKGNTVRHVYNPTGNLVETYVPDNTLTEYIHNPRGQVLHIKVDSAEGINYAYDEEGNLISISDGGHNTAFYEHDAIGRVTKETNPNHKHTIFEYDALSRVISITNPNGDQVVKTHTPSGMGSLTDPNLNTTRFVYNSLNQLMETTDALGNKTSYTYDLNGNVSSKTDPNNHTIVYIYDGLNRLTSKNYPNGELINYTYDNLGRLTGITDPKYTSNYSYDELGRLTSYTNGFNQQIRYEYDAAGNLVSLIYPGNKKVSYQYDSKNNLVQIEDWSGRQTKYHYDSKNLVTLIELPNGSRTEYEYNSADRVTALKNLKSDGSVIASYTFSYDHAGNLLSKSTDHPLNLSFQLESKDFSYGADNRIQTSGNDSITHDFNGNMMTKGNNSYQYDFENRLIKLINPDTIWEYSYDGAGNRLEVKKGESVKRYLVDPNGIGNMIIEHDQNNLPVNYFIYGLGLIYKIDAQDIPHYYHYNYSGHTIAITDQIQNIVNQYSYTPFGEMIGGDEEVISNSFKYAGRSGIMDDGNELLFMRNRYYDYHFGRFITKDPIGFYGGSNLYGYVSNNPLNYIDPMGFCKQKGGSVLFGFGYRLLGYGSTGGAMISANQGIRSLTPELYSTIELPEVPFEISAGFEIGYIGRYNIDGSGRNANIPLGISLIGPSLTFMFDKNKNLIGMTLNWGVGNGYSETISETLTTKTLKQAYK